MSTGWRISTWGDELSLEYGKAIRGYQDAVAPFRVFGANGPIGWTDTPLTDGPGIILGRKGAYRGIHFSRDPFFVIDTAYFVKPKIECDMRWLYYAMVHHKLGDIDDGSPVPSTTRSAVYVRYLEVPPLPEQRAIASILGALDDKIEVNRRMTETLEAMSRAIFHDWFVDFGPTRAKAERRGPYLAPDLWALFPNALAVEGVPFGWSRQPISEFAKVVYGAAFASKHFNSDKRGMPLIRIRDIATHDPRVFTEELHKNRHLVTPGEIVVGMDGEFSLQIWKGPSAWLNQRVCHFQPRLGVSTSFLAEALKAPLAFFERGKVGTTVIHLGKADIDTIRLISPGERIFQAFTSIAQPLVEKTVSNAAQSSTLAQTRDLLLPKLMSGGIRIRDAERVVEAAI